MMNTTRFPASSSRRKDAGRSAWLALGLLTCLALPVSAAEPPHQHGGAAHMAADAMDATGAGAVMVEGAYTAAPRPGVPNLAVFIDKVENHGEQADQLLSASTEIAPRTELHEMRMDGDMMHMRQVGSIDVPAGGTLDMNKGAGYHLMVFGVSRPLKAGDRFPLVLNFRRAGRQVVEVQVQDVAASSGGHDHHHHGHAGHEGSGHVHP